MQNTDREQARQPDATQMRVILTGLIGLFALMLSACAEQHGKSYWLRHASITLPEAVQIAEKNTPGRAIGAELKHSGTRVFYEIQIVDSANQVQVLRVDADTGKIITSLALPR